MAVPVLLVAETPGPAFVFVPTTQAVVVAHETALWITLRTPAEAAGLTAATVPATTAMNAPRATARRLDRRINCTIRTSLGKDAQKMD
jgi:hypothetical protein